MCIVSFRPLFSDFNFHSVGIPDYGPGFNKSKTDLEDFMLLKIRMISTDLELLPYEM